MTQTIAERTVEPSAGYPAAANQGKVAYIASWFPVLTETFILFEILAVEQQGAAVEVYPLFGRHGRTMHPEATALVRRAHYHPLLSLAIVRAHLHFLCHRPRAYLGALWTLLRCTWGSLRYFSGAVVLFPKVVYFARRMQLQGVTHVHAHFASHPAAAAFVIHRLTGIPYSFTVHGSDLHRDQHMLREKVAEAAFVVSISEYNRQVILKVCGRQYAEKVEVIHCGVDTAVFCPQGDAGAGADPRRPFTILSVGKLYEVKGQKFLIEACRLLRARGVEFACEMVGDGPDRQMLASQVAEAGMQDCVRFHGRITRDRIARLVAEADVLAAPSVPTRDGRREGIPVVLMEAMAGGVPVVASDLSGIPELVEHGETGLLVPPGDAAALADALERVASESQLRRRLAVAARDKIVRQFNLHTNASLLIERFRCGVPTCC